MVLASLRMRSRSDFLRSFCSASLPSIPSTHVRTYTAIYNLAIEMEGADGCSMSSERWSTAFTKGVIHRSSRSFSPYPPRTGLVESILPRQAG